MHRPIKIDEKKIKLIKHNVSGNWLYFRPRVLKIKLKMDGGVAYRIGVLDKANVSPRTA
jgi:hypothetical protein